jgi:ketosteroid isomerase-like protein
MRATTDSEGLRRCGPRNFDELRLDLETTLDAGEHVVALIHQRVHIRGSGSQLEHRVAWYLEVRNGKITRVHTYFSWEEALKAAGLDEPGTEFR